MLREIPLFVCLLVGAAFPRTDGDCSKSIAAGKFDDTGSKTVAASVVFEGTMVKMVRISNPEGTEGLPKVSAAKFIVEKIHKGVLPTADGIGDGVSPSVFLRVERGCVQNLKINRRYFVFLSSSWDSVGPEETLHFASGAPVKYSKKTVKEVLGHICRNCGSASLSSAPSTTVRLLPGQNLSVGIDSDVIVKCIAIGKPRPRVTWFKNDQPLVNADHRLLRKSFKVESHLRIKSVEYEDSARLWCQAQNVLGTANSSVLTLTVAKEKNALIAKRSHYLPCPDPSYCLKGECHVLPGASKPRCTCPQGYTGERCQDRQDEFDFSKIDVKTSNLDRILAIGTLLFQLLIFVIVVAVLNCIMRLRRQLRERSTTSGYRSAETSEFRDMNTYEKQISWMNEDTDATRDNGYRSASDLASLASNGRETEGGAEVKVHALT